MQDCTGGKAMLFRLIVLLLVTGKLFAGDLRIDVTPRFPQVDSSYTVTFRLTTKKNEGPVVSFDSQGAEVISKKSKGVSVRTKFLNGRLFTEKEFIYSYELVSSKVGTSWIRNISVNVGGEKISHPNIKIKIGREVQKLKNFFVEAQASKKDIFVGEGITVRYYVYSRGNVKNYELKSYPKLKKFLKRFIDRPERAQNVEVEGQVFRRDLLYSARVFANTPGKYRIDSIRVRVEYSKNMSNNPFNINFSLNRTMSKSLRSKEIKINVKPLPVAPSDGSFTGLVGKHSFKLSQGKNRYLVNEAIELKLEVAGEGALEAYNGPAIYTHPDLEEFETSSDLRIINADTASKVYDYTYLARDSLKMMSGEIGLTYFNPEKILYEKVTLPTLGLDIVGSGVLRSGSLRAKEKEGSEREVILSDEKKLTGIVGPVFTEGLFSKLSALKYVNVFLGVVICLLLASFFLWRESKNICFDEAQRIVKSLQEGRASYSDIFQLFHLVRGESDESLDEFIKKQKLSTRTSKYLLKLVETAEDLSYLKGEGMFKFKYDKKPFQELLALIFKKHKYVPPWQS